MRENDTADLFFFREKMRKNSLRNYKNVQQVIFGAEIKEPKNENENKTKQNKNEMLGTMGPPLLCS